MVCNISPSLVTYPIAHCPNRVQDSLCVYNKKGKKKHYLLSIAIHNEFSIVAISSEYNIHLKVYKKKKERRKRIQYLKT